MGYGKKIALRLMKYSELNLSSQSAMQYLWDNARDAIDATDATEATNATNARIR